MPETVEIIPLIVKRRRKISFSITMGGKHIVHRWTKFQLVYMVFQYYAQCTERERKMCRIRMNNLMWDVYGVQPDHLKLKTDDGWAYGMTYYDSCEIYIRNDDISAELLARVCRHEAAHAAAFSYCFDTENLSEEDLCNFVEAYGPEICKNASKMYKAILADQ